MPPLLDVLLRRPFLGLMLCGGVLSAFLLHFFLLRHPSEFDDDQQLMGIARGASFFGRGLARLDDPSIVPFAMNVSDAELADLRVRLKKTRIGHEQLEDVDSFEYGFPLRALVSWRDRWLDQFNWRKAERTLNGMGAHFRTEIEGIQIHFIHARPANRSTYRRLVPILLCHGWPGSVFEFHKLIPILVDPRSNPIHQIASSDIAFEVIVPSIPGYGWSEQPHKRGFDQLATARVFHKLMVDRLGFQRFIAQGGDWGALVVSNMARMFPEAVAGIHLNMVGFSLRGARQLLLALAGSVAPRWVFSDSEHFANFGLTAHLWELLRESGYMHIQATKPDTVGVALNDSPLGLLAYVLEKYSTWTNPAFRILSDGGLERKFTSDELLTMVSIYWFNGNILPSQRYYKEHFSGDPFAQRLQRTYIRVPTAYAAFPHEIGGVQPRELVSCACNLTQMTFFEDGGHFAALENPKNLAGDIVRFVHKLANSL